MKNLIIITLSSIVLFASCQKTEIEAPNTNADCSTDYSGHTKNTDYQDLLGSYIEKGFVGISLLVDNPEEGIWAGAAGYADIENNIKMTPCHLNYAASINKTYLAVMVLQLKEEGKLQSDDKIADYVSSEVIDKIPNGDKITIRQMLQHRSGLPDVFEADFLLDFFNNPYKSYTMEELMQYVYKVKAVSDPGTDFYYSDANFILAAMIIEYFDGNLISAYDKRIFKRLDQANSYMIQEPSQLPDKIAAGYTDRYDNGNIENVSDWQIALCAGLRGSDGLITDLTDLNRFNRSLSDGTLISQASYNEMIDFVNIPAGQSNENYSAYGLGIAKVVVSKEWVGSFGNHVGSGAIMLYNPEHNISIAVFQNKGTFFSDDAKTKFFGELIYDIEKIAFK